jgi:hypothetical protein
MYCSAKPATFYYLLRAQIWESDLDDGAYYLLRTEERL